MDLLPERTATLKTCQWFEKHDLEQRKQLKGTFPGMTRAGPVLRQREEPVTRGGNEPSPKV